jgi:hypothetical protein
MENVVFWDVVLCGSCVNQRFGGAYRLHLQAPTNADFPLADCYTLKMEAICSSEMSDVHNATSQKTTLFSVFCYLNLKLME